jgi:pimeloyl-ACP methyl ester carboxylesterase
MTFVLIHGGAHGAWCWQPMLPYLDGSALAVDLPGRGSKPGDLEKLTLRDFAASVVADIDAAGLRRVVLVGHSMAGLTIPRVVDQIPERIASVVLVSCLVPREGQSLYDAMSMTGPDRAQRGEAMLMDPGSARAMFCNDMDAAQTRFVLERLCPEAPGPMSEPASLAGLRRPVPRSYVKLLRDQALVPALQDELIRNAGPGCAVIELDAGHNAMISQPRALAGILNRISRAAG